MSPGSPGSVSVGWSVLFGLLLSEGRTFLFFPSGSGSESLLILDSAFLSYNKLILSMNLNKIKFTLLDCTYLFLCRFNLTLTIKNRDEKSMLVLIKKNSSPIAMTDQFELNQHHIVSARSADQLSDLSPKVLLNCVVFS